MARTRRTSTLGRLLADGAAAWDAEGAPLPADIDEIFAVANGDIAATAIAKARTGADAGALREAALRYIRGALHAPNASLYRRLGVPADAPVARIRKHYRELIAVFHPDRLGPDALPGDVAIATAINEAWNALKHPESRARYDRQLAAAKPAPAPIAAPCPEPPVAARTPVVRRPHWKRVRTPGRLVTWLRSQSPRTLQALAFALLLVVAGLAVVLSAPERAPALAIFAPPSPAARVAAPADEASAQRTPAAAAPARREAPTRAADAPQRVAVAPAPHGERMTFPKGAPSVAVPIAAPALRVEPVTAVPAPTSVAALAAAPAVPPVTPATVPAPPPAPGAEPSRATAPTPSEVDAVVVRFARAYEAGDFTALRALVDDETAQDGRMALTLANFARVLRESSSRRLELAVQERDADGDRARIELAARTTLAASDTTARTGSGVLTLVLQRRSGTPVIVDIRYRERPPAA